MGEVAGPYLEPSANAIVLCVDEKSQILVMDDYAAHKALGARSWPQDSQRITVHPDPCLVHEPGGGLVRPRRAPGHPPRHLRIVKDLNAKIREFIDGWNDRSHAFVRTKTAEEILMEANPTKTSKADH